MKKIFLLFATFLIATFAQAQTVTKDSLQGNWKMCAFDINGIRWDFKSDSVTLPSEYESSLGQSQKDAMIADVKTGLADYKEGTCLIKGNYIEQAMAGDTASGTFSLTEQNKKSYINIVNDDAAKSTDILMVSLKDGMMHLTIPDEIGGVTTLIYCK